MEDVISQAKADLVRTKARMAHALATTPDDRIHWSPSPSARTPVQQVAHCANVIPGIQKMLSGEPWMLSGKPFPFAGIDEFDTAMRAQESGFTTRDQALELLERNSAEYLTWLDTLTPEQLASTVHPPFSLPVPMTVAVTFAAYHTSGHVAQMDYIQTIYGDRDWHVQG